MPRPHFSSCCVLVQSAPNSVCLLHPCPVELNAHTIEEAATVPDQLWHDAQQAGLLPQSVLLPPVSSL